MSWLNLRSLPCIWLKEMRTIQNYFSCVSRCVNRESNHAAPEYNRKSVTNFLKLQLSFFFFQIEIFNAVMLVSLSERIATLKIDSNPVPYDRSRH
jgi:hypothetical protein